MFVKKVSDLRDNPYRSIVYHGSEVSSPCKGQIISLFLDLEDVRSYFLFRLFFPVKPLSPLITSNYQYPLILTEFYYKSKGLLDGRTEGMSNTRTDTTFKE